MLIVFVLLLLSALLKIKKAPLIFIYSNTIDRIWPVNKIELDEKGMRFAHVIGSIFSGICVVALYANFRYAWGVVALFAVLKIFSAVGFCPGEKIYSCMKNGCCGFAKK